MATEIKRSNWSRFCKKFNATNQLRHALVKVRRGDDELEISGTGRPFMGMAITKKGRFIDAVELFAGSDEPDRLTQPVVTIKQPIKVALEKNSQGVDTALSVEGKDGTVATVVLTGERAPEQCHRLIESLAYSLYERRGFAPGADLEDWLEAEKTIKEIELQFVT